MDQTEKQNNIENSIDSEDIDNINLQENNIKNIKQILEEDTPIKQNTVQEFAKKQRNITISEFFEKNKHILGFDNPAKSLVMCIKEMLDNSLDACEDYNVLPEVFIQIKRVNNKTYKLTVEDNGPGILKTKIANVFGKLLYGSKFHSYRQTRGQQGIGVSAAVLYSQITTGKPTTITTKYEGLEEAIKTQLKINILKNMPEIISQKKSKWDKKHGTKIEMEVIGVFVTTGKHSLMEYLKQVSVVNPHTTITFKTPDENFVFERIIHTTPKISEEVKPHPQSLELGVLERILVNTKCINLIDFLTKEMYGINLETAQKYCEIANIPYYYNPVYLTPIEIKSLYTALRTYSLSIPTESLSLIGEDFIKSSLQKEYEFVDVHTTEPGIYLGNPFIIETAICYSDKLPKEQKINMMRIGNKVPLIYQQSACLITQVITKTNWSNYGLRHTQEELPFGPVVIFVHIASTKVPYTSESKEAVADIKQIHTSLSKAMTKIGLKLANYLRRQEELERLKEKQKIISQLLPHFYELLTTHLKKEKFSAKIIISKIMDSVVYSIKDNKLQIINYTNKNHTLKLILKDGERDFICVNGIQTIVVENFINLVHTNYRDIVYNLTKLDLDLPVSEKNELDYISLISNLNTRSENIIEKLQLILDEFYNQLLYNKIPYLEIRSRTKENIVENDGYWILSDKTSIKSAKNIGSMKQILQFLNTIIFLLSQFKNNKNSTLRELYYISEGWPYAKFETQTESNYLIENLEVLLGLPREQFRIWPESNGHMFGSVILKEQTRSGIRKLDCAKDVNEGGYVIPFDLSKVELISTEAKFIMGIETAGMFKRLIENKFDSTHKCILVSLEGQPARSTRKIFKKISDKFNIPGVIFTDSDAWSMRIHASLAFGSIKTSHLSESLATPSTRFLGVKPSDILKYKLPSDKLRKSDEEALEQLLDDPRFQTEEWKYEIQFQLKEKVKSEQQALAKYGLDYVTQIYLPEKLKEMNITYE